MTSVNILNRRLVKYGAVNITAVTSLSALLLLVAKSGRRFRGGHWWSAVKVSNTRRYIMEMTKLLAYFNCPPTSVCLLERTHRTGPRQSNLLYTSFLGHRLPLSYLLNWESLVYAFDRRLYFHDWKSLLRLRSLIYFYCRWNGRKFFDSEKFHALIIKLLI